MYAEDPRTWAGLLCDAAPRLARNAGRVTRRRTTPPRADSLLALLLGCGEFTAGQIAAHTGYWESSVRTTLHNYPDRFVCVRARYGNTPAVWRARRADE